MKRLAFTFILILLSFGNIVAQIKTISGKVIDQANLEPIPFATVTLLPSKETITTDDNGQFSFAVADTLQVNSVAVSFVGYTNDTLQYSLGESQKTVRLRSSQSINEVVVTGTMKAVSRLESAIPVEVFTPKFFKKNPTPSLFDAVGMINGVRPQLNCNVCNTGDIHINGMEGPYTLILIDGMPIVSSLSTVYGLSGIPNSIVERLEVVKGPAGALYGSEAMGGIINVITKNPGKANKLSLDVMGTSWAELNADVAYKANIGNKTQMLLGINHFRYQNPIDNNKDGFTDVTIQNRFSIFNKWNFLRKENRIASIGARYVHEDRWGGQTNWSKEWRGSDSIYGESVYTRRWELIGQYQLPTTEKIMTQFSLISHDQDSYYGTTPYKANQKVAFGQLYWDKEIENHSLLLGSSFRYTYYDDNTAGTATENNVNAPMHTPLPGLFIQDEWSLAKAQKLLLGYRFDYDRNHGAIHSPRIAYKYSPNNKNTFRASFGTGFRVVNLFTEDHAALTGSRKVEIVEELRPEKSYNGNLNYVLQMPIGNNFINIDATGFYGYFTNKIIGDYLSDPNKILYNNLDGYAISRGISLNTSMTFHIPLNIMIGATWMDVYQMNDDDGKGALVKNKQLFAPNWSGNFAISYAFPKNFSVDITGQVNGPMKLPVQQNDFRPEYSPWFCIANIQVTKKLGKAFEVYGGVKNLLNFVPKNTFMRPNDPFDKYVDDPINNPNKYTFDTEYNYASLQGIKGFLGLRYTIW